MASDGAPSLPALRVVKPLWAENHSDGAFSAPVAIGNAVGGVRARRPLGLHHTPPHMAPPLGNVRGGVRPGPFPGQTSLLSMDSSLTLSQRLGTWHRLHNTRARHVSRAAQMCQCSVMFFGLLKMARSQRFCTPSATRLIAARVLRTLMVDGHTSTDPIFFRRGPCRPEDDPPRRHASPLLCTRPRDSTPKWISQSLASSRTFAQCFRGFLWQAANKNRLSANTMI